MKNRFFTWIMMAMIILLLGQVSFADEMNVPDEVSEEMTEVGFEENKPAAAGNGIAIDEAHFPDEEFRKKISEKQYDKDQNGVLSDAEISAVTQMDAAYWNVASMEGIGYFTALEKLECGFNEITSLDVSRCTKLTYLSCNESFLTSLDVSKCTKLTYLDCSWNESLTNLNISGCKELTDLSCGQTKLTSLQVSGFARLEQLWCSNTGLTSLNTSGCTALKSLSCYESKVKNLNAGGCAALEFINCSDNPLTSLNVEGCALLGTLQCKHNSLTSLDISACPKIKDAYEKGSVIHVDHDNSVQYDYGSSQLIVDPLVTIITSGKNSSAGSSSSAGTSAAAGKITITKKPAIRKVTAKKNTITVRWSHFRHTTAKTKKIWKKIRKVQVQYSTNKSFKKAVKSIKVKKSKKSAVIKGLKKNTTYYVRIRYYGGKGYSRWSKVKKIRTKNK